jgi:hypothetical protein
VRQATAVKPALLLNPRTAYRMSCISPLIGSLRLGWPSITRGSIRMPEELPKRRGSVEFCGRSWD